MKTTRYEFGVRKKCPRCGEIRRARTRRSGNWKVFPVARAYSCLLCHTHYVVLLNTVSVVLDQGFRVDTEPASGMPGTVRT